MVLKMSAYIWLYLIWTTVSATVSNDILKELSWRVKLKLINNMPPSKDHHKPSTPNTLQNSTPPIVEGVIVRSVGLQRLIARQDTSEHPTVIPDEDDNDMRLKLFRLMYETVRDSDLKVKRAQLIRDHYQNSTAFEIGYLISDITDKFNIINDIAMTLKRFYKEWKPIEHINAYEQMANQGIQIKHLIDLVRVVNKKDADSGNTEGGS